MRNKLIIKYLTIFILWIGGMSVCMAQSNVCSGGYVCSDPAETCIDEQMDVINGGIIIINPLCLSTDCSGPLKVPYCVAYDMIIPPGGYGSNCGDIGGVILCATLLPLSDASFLLVFLLGIYGFFIYRKRVVVKG